MESPCRVCHPEPTSRLEGIRALGYFEGPLRRVVHGFKYNRRAELADPLAALLARSLDNDPLAVDLLVSVPLHPDRRRARGYNQAALLAAELARRARIPLAEEALVRLRATRPQLGLSAAQRRENVRGAFQARSELVRGKTILLIDDVTTTGATLEACAQALLQAGARRVRGLVLAKER